MISFLRETGTAICKKEYHLMEVVLPKKLRALLYTASTASTAYIAYSAYTAYTACMCFGAKSRTGLEEVIPSKTDLTYGTPAVLKACLCPCALSTELTYISLTWRGIASL